MGLNLNPILRQELANLDKDTESRKSAMKALKSYVKDLDSKSIPGFLAQVFDTKDTTNSSSSSSSSLSGEYTISLYEILARVHGPNIVPQIDTIMSTIVKTLSSSAAASSFSLQQACSKVVPAIARYGIDPTSTTEDKKRLIIHSLCNPLAESLLLSSQESLTSGSALCLKALVDCDNWRFASDEMVNKVCQNVVVALDSNSNSSNQTHLQMGLVMSLAKHNPLIVEAYARLLIRTGLRGVSQGNSQKRLSAVQMLNFLMKCLDPRCIYSEVELIIKAMEKCQSDQMAYVRGAAYEAMMTSKKIAGELEKKIEFIGCRSVTGSNFSQRNIVNGHSPDGSLSPESQTLGSFSGYDSPVESSLASYNSGSYGRSVNRKLWRRPDENGGVDISLRDGIFSGVTKGSTTVSDSPLVPYDHCENGYEFEGFLIGSPQRQQRSRRFNDEDFTIFSTPRKLISSLQYHDDHSDIQSPMVGKGREKSIGSRKNTRLRKQVATMEETKSSSTVMFSEETTTQTHMKMGKKKMSYAKQIFVISFVMLALFTSVMLMVNQDDDVGYNTVPT